MTLLTIVSGAAIRVGYTPVPSAAFTSSNPTVQQLVAFAQDAGQELLERWSWRNLNTAGTITGDGATTLWPLPSDFQRLGPSDKSPKGAFVSNVRPLLPLAGPVNDEDLNQLKALPAAISIPVWRIINGNIEIWPALGLGEVVTYNYYSSSWITTANGPRGAWTADTDVSRIVEDTIMKGVIWRYQAAKGLDYAESFRAYELSADRNAGQEGTERIVSMSSRSVGAAAWAGTITDLTDQNY